jgi:hypothetical protein
MFLKGFWQRKILTHDEQADFQQNCFNIYKDKTFKRIDLFYKMFKYRDNAEIINDISYPSLNELLCSIDWNSLLDGIPGRFHGDLHFENILYLEKEKTFIFVDWRQDFNRSLDIGDIYYDFAKLLHGIIINHEIIIKKAFTANWINNRIEYDFCRRQRLIECEAYYYTWLKNEGYDIKKINTIISLLFLSCAVLHNHPYNILLYGLGKTRLYATLTNG